MTTIDLDSLHLDRGDHSGPDDGLCLMEAVAYVAGEPHSDHPACVSPVLGAFGRELNDRLDSNRRQKLKPLIPLLPGTAGDGLDEQRGYRALDWLVRTYAPAWLDLAGLTAEAAELRALRRIADLAAAEAAGPVVRAGRDRAREKWAVAVRQVRRPQVAAAAGAAAGAAAAGAAAGAVAWDAAGDAAGDAAWDAAGDAWDAAWAAAGAAWAAAWAAGGVFAWDAARAALKPTVEQLQDSTIDLFRQMINPEATS